MTTNPRLNFRLALFAAVMATGAAPTLAAQSSAYALSADLTTDGSSHVQLPALLPTSGATTLGQTYDKPLSAALFSKSVRLLPAALRGPLLTVVEQKLATDAAGANGVDAVNTSGTSSAATGLVTLTLFPPPPGPISPITPVTLDSAVTDAATGTVIPLTPLGYTALNIQFSKLKARASYDQIFPRPALRSGSTSFAKLTISGPLVGAKLLSFSGDIAPNTVVVNTPTVKITLNAQFIPQQPVCLPNVVCPMYRVLETVETKAILIELNGAALLGHQVSGNIVIGEAEAGQ